ncbi:MAG: hypothetical protein CME65_11925 [Halobacteriovoraceae bacterium]|nr:hypothetical protein [Halobacteriovoraceae bacterium]|tara:strand:- start:1765 stop:2787 length:1023 start_codon:yes stop_codon:yes gene_type:complete
MKPELSEQLFIEELFKNSIQKLNDKSLKLKSIDKLTGDASTRRYYRLYCEGGSFVACLDNPTEVGANSFVNVQEFLEGFGVRVPRVFDKVLEKGYILEEDLGNETLLHYLSSVESSARELEIYKKVIDPLIEIHKVSDKKMVESNLFQQKFDFEKLHWEIEFTLDFYYKRFLNIENEKDIENISDLFRPICERLSSKKMVLTHRDFHSRNVMIKDEDYIIIDFQDARWGIPQYDLVSMLDDCYYKITEPNKKEIKKYYYRSLGEEIIGQDWNEFNSLYDDMVLQRVFKAIGSFGYIYATRKDVRYIKYVGFAMEKIRKVMMKDPKYDDLRKVMFRNYYAS